MDDSWSRAEKGGELFVPGSPVAGFSGTTRILRMRFESAYLQPVNLADTMIAPNFSNSAVRSMISHSWTLIRSFHLAAP
ncbi:hypothetical protein IEQ34_023541 [Dendrobium chrysotoxum]|uniref:Uncharacterized protein n=1 Tax=Dendrobium chrysotoxum TaxID=161865 RepID=A0AAV7FSU9_DENCH|nr:hypothetical protein IEQ34_024745 [Dendrobium chrysotoxum]KAH0447616.1 hypothetical protein IEQ34_023541 [Dendrobium chrysotoxum]